VLTDQERDDVRNTILAGLLDKMKESKTQRGATSWWLLRAAATLLLIAVSGYVIWQSGLFTGTMREAVAGATGRKVILPDHTLVWLKDHSRLIYPQEFTGIERAVTLEGEALFEVTKDAAHPFIIHCGEFTATVLGTSFNLKTDSDGVEVTVFTGQVALTPSSATFGLPEVIVLPNERAVYDPQAHQVAKVRTLEPEIQALTAGTEYAMRFEDERVAQVVRRIEEKFGVTIIVESPLLNNCLVTANLTDQSLEHTLDIVTDMLDARYEKKNNGFVLQGIGCPR
jgi:ferric-dicitrate binding protein FerR (iron transport regulator)